MKMTVDEGVRMVAGLFILASVALGLWVSPWWFAFTAFVGANLLQSAFSRFCPMMGILRRAGFAEHGEPGHHFIWRRLASAPRTASSSSDGSSGNTAL